MGSLQIGSVRVEREGGESGKKKRGRRERPESDWRSYKEEMEAKVSQLLVELNEHRDGGDKQEERRIKNLICAYESRLNKRAQQEEAKEKL